MTEPTLAELYGDLPAATAKLVVVDHAIDALERVVEAIGALDGAAFEPLYDIAGELTVHIADLGGELVVFRHLTSETVAQLRASGWSEEKIAAAATRKAARSETAT